MRRLFACFVVVCIAVCGVEAQNTARTDSLLCAIHDKDQSVRMELMQIIGGDDTDAIITLSLEMNRLDAENQAVVFAILDSGGWPAGLSAEANDAIFLVVDHADPDSQQKYLPLVEAAAASGTISRSDWATLYDRVQMGLERPQRFGTQTVMFDKTTYLWPVEDAASLDSLRSSVGLCSLTEYFESFAQYGIAPKWDASLSVKELQRMRTE